MRHNSLSELFKDIADAIRNKTGSSENLVADDFDLAINNISGGGVMTLLWQNYEFNKNFAEQTVYLDLSNYEGVVIIFTNNNSSTTTYFGRHFIYKNTGIRCFSAFSTSATSGTPTSRTVTVTETGVTFSVGRSGTSNSNGNMIPIEIYGVKSKTSTDMPYISKQVSDQLGVTNYAYERNDDGTFNLSWDVSAVSGYEGLSLAVLTPRNTDTRTYRISMSIWHNCPGTTNSTYKQYWGLSLQTDSALQVKHTIPFGEANVWEDISIDITPSTVTSEMVYARQWLVFAMAGLGSSGRFEVKNLKIERIS